MKQKYQIRYQLAFAKGQYVAATNLLGEVKVDSWYLPIGNLSQEYTKKSQKTFILEHFSPYLAGNIY